MDILGAPDEVQISHSNSHLHAFSFADSWVPFSKVRVRVLAE